MALADTTASLAWVSVTFLNSFFKAGGKLLIFRVAICFLKDNFEWIILGSDSVDISGVD
jgi:hypothetical protein